MKKSDILIIGGGPGGVVVALTARKNNPDKKIVLIRKTKLNPIPCGIPYIFCRLDSVEKNTIPDTVLSDNNIKLIVGEVSEINRENKTINLKTEKIEYEKLILATGSNPKIISIKGFDENKHWLIKKDCNYLNKLREEILKAKNIVIIGGGFIGMEIAEELSVLKDKNITIVEVLNRCLGLAFDQEFAQAAENELKEKGINIYTNAQIKEIRGNEVIFKNGKKIPADIIILSVGAQPEINLAEKSGLEITENKSIEVDEYMQTSDSNIFAIGDCALKKDSLTKKPVPAMLASTACYEGRIAGSNLFINKIKNDGVVSIFSTCLGNLTLAATGYNKCLAEKEKLNILIGSAETPCHHPGSLPNTQPIATKLIFDKTSKKIIGGQIMGPKSVGEIINIVGLAIQKEMTVSDLILLQVGTHPLLTASPIVYPIIKAAETVL